jgi:sec-independent protein translocase protein TatA
MIGASLPNFCEVFVMFGLGGPELLIILAIIVLLFGATKIPQLGKSIGEGLSNFKKGLKDADNTPTDTALRPDVKVTDVPRKPENT